MRKSKSRILVIDDDVFFANYVVNTLTDLGGYSVTQSHSVDEGLELACRGKFPLIIVDLKMPPGKSCDSINTSGGHKTGLVLAREIRKASPSDGRSSSSQALQTLTWSAFCRKLMVSHSCASPRMRRSCFEQLRKFSIRTQCVRNPSLCMVTTNKLYSTEELSSESARVRRAHDTR